MVWNLNEDNVSEMQTSPDFRHLLYQQLFVAELWERICRKTFAKEHRKEFESWRELYERCTTARQKKLDFLAVRVQQSYKNVQQNHRKTKLAYVDDVAKAPRDIQRAQVKKLECFADTAIHVKPK